MAFLALAGLVHVPCLAANPSPLPLGHVYLQADFDSTHSLNGWSGQGKLEGGYHSERALTIESRPGGAGSVSLVSVDLLAEAM